MYIVNKVFKILDLLSGGFRKKLLAFAIRKEFFSFNFFKKTLINAYTYHV